MGASDLKLSPLSIALLKALSALAASGRGWNRRGVRGWAFSDELPSADRTVDALRRLAEAERVRREDVRDPFRVQPTHIHRITQVGQNILADAAGLPHVRIHSPSEVLTDVERETIYVSIDTWRGLEFLAAQEPGIWFTPDEMKAASGVSFGLEDANFLTPRGMILRQQAPARREGAGRSPRNYYQATALGRAARLLDRSVSERRVQVHVPGLLLAAGEAPPPLPGRRPPLVRNAGSISGG